jgi:hypothetical protein
VARQATQNPFGSQNIFYARFVYDLISMFGLNLFYIELPTLEFLVRKVFQAVTFKFDGRLRIRSLADVKPAFTEEEYNLALEIQQQPVIEKLPEIQQQESKTEFKILPDLQIDRAGIEAARKLHLAQKRKTVSMIEYEKSIERPF